MRPTFLLLDEPFANIDPRSIDDLQDLIRHLAQKDISILITDHNAREIFSVVDRSYIVQDGRVLLSGTVDELVHNETAKKNYLGQDFRI
jgi:lipopolysaccharide export system ATP-binding protein